MKVLKFGGTSVASTENIIKVGNIVTNKIPEGKLLVVVSAFGGVTNDLEQVINLAVEDPKEARTLVSKIIDRHQQVIHHLLNQDNQEMINPVLAKAGEALAEMINGINIIGEATPRVKDKIMSMGERLSSTIIQAHFSETFNSTLVDPLNFIITDDTYGSARVNYTLTYDKISHYSFADIEVAVCPGFIGGTEAGSLTTLGRGGSDFSAALWAHGLEAEVLEIWTDVSGMMTADPRIVKTAKTIKKITFEEAMELSHFGAKVIYPPTIQPVLQVGIPIRIKNTLDPEAEGTLITKDQGLSEKTVQGISSIQNLALVNLKGPGMVGVPNMSYRLFKCFANNNINIILITQASSEHTISIVITTHDAALATRAVSKEFSMEIELGRIDPLEVEKDLAIVALVGSNMLSQVGVSGKMFSILGANGVNIKAIAQGASERNISAVIRIKNLKKAINSLHEGFFLSERKRLNLFIIGIGNVGSEFLNQIRLQAPVLLDHEHLDIRVVGIANSRKMIFSEEGIDLDNWQADLHDGHAMNTTSFIQHMSDLNLRNSIFIDNTASDSIPEHYVSILGKSTSIVTPNKVAASSSYDNYQLIKQTALRFRTQFLFETNVGAGLPIISTLKDLVKSGDKIIAIKAVLSGSLNFIFNKYNASKPLADIVKQAQIEGYTEPDPRIDLSGLDVKRKLLILMREAGIACEQDDIQSKQFIPQECFAAENVEQFYSILKAKEDEFKTMLKETVGKHEQLKYVAQYQDGVATTELMSVGVEHPFYNLEGKDNIILFYTRRYPEQPLIIKGAGAGAEVTASGIFADVIKVANS